MTFSRLLHILFFAAFAILPLSLDAQAEANLDLKVLYLGVMHDARTADFRTFLSEHFAGVETMERSDYLDKANGVNADVILLDWHQGEGDFPPKSSFLGAWGELKTPAVLLGSAGLLHAVASELRGGFG